MSKIEIISGMPDTDTLVISVNKKTKIYVERDEDGRVHITLKEGNKGETHVLGED